MRRTYNQGTLQAHFEPRSQLRNYHKSYLQRRNENLYRQDSLDPEFLEIKKYGFYFRVSRFEGDTAYCYAIYKGRKLPVELNKRSLEDYDYKGGDLFRWRARKDGVVKLEDVTNHPRRLTEEEIEEGRIIFEELRKNWKLE